MTTQDKTHADTFNALAARIDSLEKALREIAEGLDSIGKEAIRDVELPKNVIENNNLIFLSLTVAVELIAAKRITPDQIYRIYTPIGSEDLDFDASQKAARNKIEKISTWDRAIIPKNMTKDDMKEIALELLESGKIVGLGMPTFRTLSEVGHKNGGLIRQKNHALWFNEANLG